MNYRRECRKENAKKRLDEVLIPIKREFDSVTTNIRVTGKPLFFWNADYRKELHDLHEGIEKSYAFDILRTSKPKLYAGIEGFFTNLLKLEQYEQDMGREIWSVIDNSITNPDLDDSRPGHKREIFDMLLPGVVLGWEENEVMRRYARKIREIWDLGDYDVDDGPIYLSKAYGLVRDLDSVKAYAKYRRFFLKKSDALLKRVSGQMEKDKKLIPG